MVERALYVTSCATWRVRFTHLRAQSDSFTCGFVFILALSCPPVRILLDAGAVEQSWQQCQTILESISTTSLSVQKSLQLLRRLYDGMVTRSQGLLANALLFMISNTLYSYYLGYRQCSCHQPPSRRHD